MERPFIGTTIVSWDVTPTWLRKIVEEESGPTKLYIHTLRFACKWP